MSSRAIRKAQGGDVLNLIGGGSDDDDDDEENEGSSGEEEQGVAAPERAGH